MITCTAVNCVMPARWRPLLKLRSAEHWDRDEAILEPDVCFCEIHKPGASPESLFSKKSRRAVDISFVESKRIPPDWSTASVDWAPVDPRSRSLWCFAVHANMPEHPDKYSVFRFGSGLDRATGILIAVEDSLEAVRVNMPPGLVRTERTDTDEPTLLEVWG